jgi:hypothetical protein
MIDFSLSRVMIDFVILVETAIEKVADMITIFELLP